MHENLVEKSIDIKSLWLSVMAKKGSIAMWRCPNGERTFFLADISGSPSKGRIDLQTTDPGFIISPFMNPEGNETLFLKTDILASDGKNSNWKIEIGDPWGHESFGKNDKVPYHLNTRPDTEISGEKHILFKWFKMELWRLEKGNLIKWLLPELMMNHYQIILILLINLIDWKKHILMPL
jgi:hypothetical protein